MRGGTHACLCRDAHSERARLDLDLEPLDLLALASVDLVEDLAVELDVDALGLRRLHERGLADRADRRASDRARPLPEGLGVGHADLEQPVLGRRAVERLHPTEERADVADEQAARVALVPEVAVHLDARLEGLDPQVLGGSPDVREAPVAILRAAVGVADHARVETCARHDREVLAVHLPQVELPLPAVEPDVHGFRDVVRDVQIRCEQVRRSRRKDRESGIAACHHVDTALHHAVAAPREDRLCAFLERLLDPLGRVLALRDLRPDRIRDSGSLEHLPELLEPPTHRLARVGDDGDLGHGVLSPAASPTPSRRSVEARAARAAKTTITRAARPMSSPATTSLK